MSRRLVPLSELFGCLDCGRPLDRCHCRLDDSHAAEVLAVDPFEELDLDPDYGLFAPDPEDVAL